jgi:hypothetical protein
MNERVFLTRSEFAQLCRDKKLVKTFPRGSGPVIPATPLPLSCKKTTRYIPLYKDNAKEPESIATLEVEKKENNHLLLNVQSVALFLETAVTGLTELSGHKVEGVEAKSSTQLQVPQLMVEPKSFLIWEKLDSSKTDFNVLLAGPGSKKTQMRFTLTEPKMKELLKTPKASFLDLVRRAEPIQLEAPTLDLVKLLSSGGPVTFSAPGSRLQLLDNAAKDPKWLLRGLEPTYAPKKPIIPWYNADAKDAGVLLIVDNYGPWEVYEGLKQNLWAGAADAFGELHKAVEANGTILAAGVVNQRYDKLLSGESLKPSVTRLERVIFNEFRGLDNGHYPADIVKIVLGEGSQVEANRLLAGTLKEAKTWRVVIVLPPPRFNRDKKMIDPLKVENKGERSGSATPVVLSTYLDGLDKPAAVNRLAMETELQGKALDVRYLVLKTNQTPPIQWSGNALHEELEAITITPDEPEKKIVGSTKTVAKEQIKEALSKLLK